MAHTLLLADKSVTIQKIVELTFADDDYVIKTVSDGQTALDVILDIRPDLILADISLPIISGYEICRRLRNDLEFHELANTPVVLLAGIYETMDEERARQVEQRVREVGANAFLSKPFDPQSLTAKVKELLPSSEGKMDTVPEFASESNMFDSSSQSAEDIFAPSFDSATEDESLYTPPDEEKTMMLPGPPTFAENIFASESPFQGAESTESEEQEEETVFTKPPVADVDMTMLSPESAFEEEDEKFHEIQEEIPEFEEETEMLQQAVIQEKLDISQPSFSQEESISDTFAIEEEDQGTVAFPKIIAASTEEPFGEMFDEASSADWTTGSSEEDAPFGVPLPPQQEVSMPAYTESAEEIFEAPLTLPEEEEKEELLEQPAFKPDFGEQTYWRAMAAVDEDQVPQKEESVEASVASEEPEKMQSEVAEEPMIEEEPAAIEEPVAASPPPTEITDKLQPVTLQESQAVSSISEDLVERIAERVLAKLSERVVSDIVWQVVPDLAERMIRRELEKLHASGE